MAIGSWGTPELGITERLSDFFGQGRTSTGGSNLFGNQTQTTLVPSGITSSGQTQFAPSGSSGAYGVSSSSPTSTTTKNPAPTTTNTSGSTGGSVLGTSTSSNQPSAPDNSAMMNEINNIYNPQMGYLNTAEQNLRGDLPSALAEAESAFTTNQALLQNKQSQSLRDLGTAETSAGTRKEDAITAARRLYNELQMGGRQRFGGATSAGEAFSELSNRELQRNMGGIGTNYEQAVQQIGLQKQKVDEDYNAGLLQLTQQKQSAVNQVQRDFQNKLLEITRMRAETESNKAQMRLQALQDLRNQVYAIDLQNKQFEQQLALQRASSGATLNTIAENFLKSTGVGQTATQNFTANTPTNINTALTVNRAAPNTATTQMTGAVTPTRRPEDIIGVATPTVNPDERLYQNTFNPLGQ